MKAEPTALTIGLDKLQDVWPWQLEEWRWHSLRQEGLGVAGGQFGTDCLTGSCFYRSLPHLNTRSLASPFCPAELLSVSQTGFALSCVQAFVSTVLSAKKSVTPSFSSESLPWSCTNVLICQSLCTFLSSLPDFKICVPFTLMYPAPNIRPST